MNIEVRRPESLASTYTLACVVAAAEVDPLLRTVREQEGCVIKAICILDQPEGGESLEDPAAARESALPEGAAGVDCVLISERCDLMTRDVAMALVELSLQSVPIRWVSSFIDQPEHLGRSDRPDPDAIAAIIEAVDAHSPGRRMKRLIDVIFAALGLIFLLPLMLLVAAIIRLDSRGNPIFRQERLGQYRHPFWCMKFRTMCIDAEGAGGPQRTCSGDPRITRVGSFLRKSRLDELPQLLNVLKGDMSIVGPRPIRAFFADQLAALVPIYEIRFIEKPGLTGLAQVRLAYPQTLEEEITKLQYDFDYIRRRSLWVDLRIMAQTAWVVLRMKGL